MAYLKHSKASCLYNVIAAKSCGKTRSVQYIIPGKSPFKTSIDALQLMLLKLKKQIPQEFCLPALQPYSLIYGLP